MERCCGSGMAIAHSRKPLNDLVTRGRTAPMRSCPRARSRCGSPTFAPRAWTTASSRSSPPPSTCATGSPHYLGLIQDAATEAVGLPVKSTRDGSATPESVVAATRTRRDPTEHKPLRGARRRVRRAPGLPFPNYTFETFVPGRSNRFAHAAAMAVAESAPVQGVQPAVHLRRRGPRQDPPARRDRPPHASAESRGCA